MILFRTASKNSKSTTIGARVALTPSIGLGIRKDGGDAEVNRAPDVSLGLVLADGVRGVTVDGRMRRLPVHKAAEFAEHGIAVSVGCNPTAKTPTGVAGLFSRGTFPAGTLKPAASRDPGHNATGNRGTTRCERRAPNARLTPAGTRHRTAAADSTNRRRSNDVGRHRAGPVDRPQDSGARERVDGRRLQSRRSALHERSQRRPPESPRANAAPPGPTATPGNRRRTGSRSLIRIVIGKTCRQGTGLTTKTGTT